MIIDSPILTQIAQGAGRVIPQAGDSQVLLPPVINVIAPSTQPTFFNPSSISALQNSSVLTITEFNRTAQAAATVQITKIPKGLYEMTFSMASLFNFTFPGGSSDGLDVRLTTVVASLVVKLMVRFPFIGSFNDSIAYRILLQEDVNISIRLPVTGVGENMDVSLTTSIVRMI